MSEEKKEQEAIDPQAEPSAKEESKKPAGFASFIQRAVALYLDLIIIFTAYYLIELILIKPIFEVSLLSCCMDLFSRPDGFIKTISGLYVILFLQFIIYLLINSLLESRSKSSGIGKQTVGIYVLDEHLKPIVFKKSLFRSFSKLLSVSVFGVGFFLYFFNQKKQALHDIIAKTVVVRRGDVDVNRLTVAFSFCFVATIAFAMGIRFILPKPAPLELTGLPKRAVDVIPPAKGFIQQGDSLIKLKDSVAVYDPLRERIEVFASANKFSEEQLQNLTSQYQEKIPEFVDFKVSMKIPAESVKCSADENLETNYFVSGELIDISENKPEISNLRCELINASHFMARFFRKKAENTQTKNWEIELSSKLNIRREAAKLKFDSENSQSSIAIWHHDNKTNIVEVGFFSAKLNEQELLELRKSKSLTEKSPELVVTFELQPAVDNLNVATVTKYGVSFLRTKETHFPGKSDRVDFFYVPAVTENLQLAKLSGKLSEGERVSGYLNHQAKKVIAEVDFDVEWDVGFNLPLLDLEVDPIASARFGQEESQTSEKIKPSCLIKADQSEFEGVDTVALYYPEEGDVAVGVFADKLSSVDKEEFRKKKSIWLNVNGKAANFVVFFDLKRESQSFSRELLLEYSVYFIRDKYGRLYFPGDTDRAQFSFKDIDFTPDDVKSLNGTLAEGSEISFNLKKGKESKLTGIHFSWDCSLNATIMKAN